MVKVATQLCHTFKKTIISIGQLETTADVDGDIGGISMIHHSKALDLYFSDLSWSNALCSVPKTSL